MKLIKMGGFNGSFSDGTCGHKDMGKAGEVGFTSHDRRLSSFCEPAYWL
jgi:hypothetical protein